MGCDIHCYIEYREKDPQNELTKTWTSFGKGITADRNYEIFAKLAGVRNRGDITPVSPPRGLPERKTLGFWARFDCVVFISKDNPTAEGNCSPENAERWVKDRGCKIIDGSWVTDPDIHSHSWCSADELESVLKDPRTNSDRWCQDYFAILAAMRSFEQQGFLARMVFWFDN